MNEQDLLRRISNLEDFVATYLGDLVVRCVAVDREVTELGGRELITRSIQLFAAELEKTHRRWNVRLRAPEGSILFYLARRWAARQEIIGVNTGVCSAEADRYGVGLSCIAGNVMFGRLSEDEAQAEVTLPDSTGSYLVALTAPLSPNNVWAFGEAIRKLAEKV